MCHLPNRHIAEASLAAAGFSFGAFAAQLQPVGAAAGAGAVPGAAPPLLAFSLLHHGFRIKMHVKIKRHALLRGVQ